MAVIFLSQKDLHQPRSHLYVMSFERHHVYLLAVTIERVPLLQASNALRVLGLLHTFATAELD